MKNKNRKSLKLSLKLNDSSKWYLATQTRLQTTQTRDQVYDKHIKTSGNTFCKTECCQKV